MVVASKIAAARLIERYETVAMISRDMRAAACAGDQGRFDQLIHECREQIADLQLAARSQVLAQDDRSRRLQLLQGMLEDDAEIRRCCEPAHQRIEQWLSVRRGN